MSESKHFAFRAFESKGEPFIVQACSLSKSARFRRSRYWEPMVHPSFLDSLRDPLVVVGLRQTSTLSFVLHPHCSMRVLQFGYGTEEK